MGAPIIAGSGEVMAYPQLKRLGEGLPPSGMDRRGARAGCWWGWWWWVGMSRLPPTGNPESV